MARIRTIKPEMPSDEKLARVSRDARLTFNYLITQADDDGLVPGAPRQLLGMLFPHDADVTEAHVVAWCSDLAGIGLVRWRETRGGAPVLQLVKWEKHQKIKHRAKPVLAATLLPYIDADSMTSSGRDTSHSGDAPEPYLIAPDDPPEDVGRVAGGLREPLRLPSPTNQQPATMDHGPTTTLDHGPATSNPPTDGVAASAVVTELDASHRVALIAAANEGCAAQYGAQPVPYRWDHPSTFQLAAALEAAGVELEFARRCLYTFCATRSAADGRRPRHPKYFTELVVEAWRDEQQRRMSAHLVTPHRLPSAEPPSVRSEYDALMARVAAGEFLDVT